MGPVEDKLALLRQLAADNQPVRLINNYRGFPVSSDASILDINQGIVTMQVYEYQAVCAALEGHAFIHSEYFPEVYKATTVHVDILEKKVQLTGFSGVGNSVGQRAFTRVQPADPLEATLITNDQQYPARLADISTTGVGVYTLATYVYQEEQQPFAIGAPIVLAVNLPNQTQPVEFHGEVAVLRRAEGEYLHRLGVRLEANPKYEQLLKEYVTLRQDELMRELSLIYDSMRYERLQGKKLN